MECYECATKAGAQASAVALCRDCGAGLCVEHVREAAARPRAGGTHVGCGHDTWLAPAVAAGRTRAGAAVAAPAAA